MPQVKTNHEGRAHLVAITHSLREAPAPKQGDAPSNISLDTSAMQVETDKIPEGRQE